MIMHFLANNKKLALSIAVNVMFAFALLMLLYFVHPQFIYELDSVSHWGQYSVRTYRKYEAGTAYFEVLMGPGKYLRQPRLLRRIYSYSGRQAFYVEIFGKDLTGNGVPNLVIRQWKGSAHGDSEYLVLEINDSVITETDIVDGLLDVKFQDLNNDGITEIAGLDKAYSYFLGDSFAASPCPLVVLSFDKIQAKFVPDKKLMSKRPWSQSQLDKLGLQYKNDPSWSEETRPPYEIFDTMLKLIYSGNEQQAWELFDASWPDAAKIPKEQYRRSIEVHSRKSLFYPVIAGWNKEKTEVLPVGQGN